MLRQFLQLAGSAEFIQFQWAPTLGGECYYALEEVFEDHLARFQWAPTLGGECYAYRDGSSWIRLHVKFQWAPTLGGECYHLKLLRDACIWDLVSMGTHPWG